MEDFEAVYAQYFRQVYQYIFSLCGNEAVAEEVTQEAFYKALEHMEQFDGRCKLSVWLCQIAKHTLYHECKKQKRRGVELEEALPEQGDGGIEDRLLDKEAAWELHQLLHRLEEPYKEVFLLRVFGELPFSQIGALFGKTDSWARLIFYRARKKIRGALHEPIL